MALNGMLVINRSNYSQKCFASNCTYCKGVRRGGNCECDCHKENK